MNSPWHGEGHETFRFRQLLRRSIKACNSSWHAVSDSDSFRMGAGRRNFQMGHLRAVG
jgi:hypothetical protein